MTTGDCDGDRVGDTEDNCPSVFNPDQADMDGDTRGDACDDNVDGDRWDDDEDDCPRDPENNKLLGSCELHEADEKIDGASDNAPKEL